MKDNRKSFSIVGGKGFSLTFSNGVTVSVQFGPANYCENRDYSTPSFMLEESKPLYDSNNAEVGIWKADGTWITRQIFEKLGEKLDDDVKGWVDADTVALLIQAATEYHC